MNKKVLVSGIVLIILGIILGAFGAHGLKTVVSDANLIAAFETGVRYQMYHGIALLILGLSKIGNLVSKWPFRLVILGVLFFSGSIYLLATAPIFEIDLPKVIAVLTPVGGTILIVSWLMILIKIIREKSIFVEK